VEGKFFSLRLGAVGAFLLQPPREKKKILTCVRGGKKSRIVTEGGIWNFLCSPHWGGTTERGEEGNVSDGREGVSSPGAEETANKRF